MEHQERRDSSLEMHRWYSGFEEQEKKTRGNARLLDGFISGRCSEGLSKDLPEEKIGLLRHAFMWWWRRSLRA